MSELRLKLVPAEDIDIWLSCILCGAPTNHPGCVSGVEVPGVGRMHGPPVEFNCTIRGDGWRKTIGLHKRCLERQERFNGS